MDKELFDSLPLLEWMPSRIPARDALTSFIPLKTERSQAIDIMSERIGEARWYSNPDGLRVVFPYDGKGYDPGVYHIEQKAWDYNECHANIEHFIPAMTLCYVTKMDPYVLLCEACYKQYVQSSVEKS